MNHISLFMMLALISLWIGCADQTSDYTPEPLTLEELMTVETMSWQENATAFAEVNTLVAFAMEAEDLRLLSQDGTASLRFSLALNREQDVLAYVTADEENSAVGNNDGNRMISIANHVTRVASISLPPATEPLIEPENSIAHEVAASWTNQWTKDGHEWLRNNELHSFFIPAKSIHGVLSARPEQAVFHMALEDQLTDGLIPHLVLTGMGNLKNESSCFDFVRPCPPTCP